MNENLQCLKKRRRIIQGAVGVTIRDPKYGDVLVTCAYNIVTFGTGVALIGLHAEGLVGTFVYKKPIVGSLVFVEIKRQLQRLYLTDCKSEQAGVS